jgi:peptidoglycan/xylan/chitin deacetylase (PgdA/CDA1 family)
MERRGVTGTWIVCGATLEKYPAISRAAQKLGHTFAGHTYEHEMMCNYPPEQELALIKKTVSVFEDILGEKLRGWRTCFASHNTIDLLLQHFDFDWDASMWNDDLPYVIEGHGNRLLEIPFSAYGDAALAIQITHPAPVNPFCTWHTNTPAFIAAALKAQFDALYERGAEQAVLMPLSVHDFIVGRPSRSKTLDDFIAYARQFEGVVFTTHDQVRGWWLNNYPA